MRNRTIQTSIIIATVSGLLVAVGCGSDDDNSGGGTKSFSQISSQIEEPTGTVDATTVGAVGEKFGEMSSASLGGSRLNGPTNTAEQACPSGGSMTASGSGNESSGSVSVKYNECCYTAGCCFSGVADTVYSDANTNTFSYCIDADLDYSCEGQQLALDYAACQGPEGLVYAVEVAGATFAVSGQYSGGNGQLTIKGANGSWTCTYTDGAGTCTGSGEDFSF